MPRDEWIYYLDTDASDIALGTVLSLEQDGEEVALAYASSTLTGHDEEYRLMSCRGTGC